MEHELYMQRAAELAALGLGKAAPNPQVGAVVVYEGKVIGEGYHERCGEAHAEVNAINSVKDKILLSKSTIYVTLEPCFHYGKTPPCVDLILKHKIPKVVIACQDPFEKVAGKSIQKLRKAGVEVLVGVLAEEVAWLNRRFFRAVTQKRPYVVLKYAQSQDGFIGRVGERTPISNAWSKRLVHRWRSEESAILVGTQTAAVDNPRLNVRHYVGKSPLRLVLDRNLRLSKNLHLFQPPIPTWVFTAQSAPKTTNSHLRYVQLTFDDKFLSNMFGYLHEQKIQSVLIEGGATLLQSCIDQNLWDEARVITGTPILGQGIAAPTLPQPLLQKEEKIAQNNYSLYVNKLP